MPRHRRRGAVIRVWLGTAVAGCMLVGFTAATAPSSLAVARRGSEAAPPTTPAPRVEPPAGMVVARQPPVRIPPVAEPPVPAPPATPPTERAPSGFVHPGILVAAEQLDFVDRRIDADTEPWAEAFQALVSSRWADLEWTPKPRAVVECGPYSTPDIGCRDEWNDGLAAYTHALLWSLTDDRDHARKAIEIIDSWSTTLTGHTGANAPIQAAWSSIPFLHAAEIIRHTYPAWSPEAVARAEAMFRTVVLPLVDGGAAPRNGNWDLVLLNAAVGIAVFTDDRELFDQTITRWRARLPAFIYLASDGPRPVAPPGAPSSAESIATYWHGQWTYVDGLTQETCRDLNHAGWGLAAAAQFAETAWIQGVDLYGEFQPRLVAALELHSGLALGDPVPDWLCGGQLASSFEPAPEIALNHYANRIGLALPRTAEFVASHRPQLASHFFAWGTLTHGGPSRT